MDGIIGIQQRKKVIIGLLGRMKALVMPNSDKANRKGSNNHWTLHTQFAGAVFVYGLVGLRSILASPFRKLPQWYGLLEW